MAKTQAEVRAAKDAKLAERGYNTNKSASTPTTTKTTNKTIIEAPVVRPTSQAEVRANKDAAIAKYGYTKERSFGKNTYDSEAYDVARNNFMDWMLNTGSSGGANNAKYGYNWNDPEDVERFNNRQISKKYEASYSSNPYDQWLKANGQASMGFFEDKYYAKAYSSVMADRAEKQAVQNFRKAVVQEAWSSASDVDNITGDDIAAAAQRVQIKNPQFANIELGNPKIDYEQDFSDYTSPALAAQEAAEKDAEKRAYSLYLDDVLSDIEQYQRKNKQMQGQAVAEYEANEAKKKSEYKNIIDLAIQESGYSEEIDKRVGLARDSKLDEWNANKELKKQAATNAVGAMRVAGASKDEIRSMLNQDGRLSYIEDSEQGIADESQRIARESSMDEVANAVLDNAGAYVQAAVAKATRVNSGEGKYMMGTALNDGFSPISMLELTDQEEQAVNAYLSAVRAELAQNYDPFEIDNAIRRADLEQYLDKDAARENYLHYTFSEMGYDEATIAKLVDHQLSTEEGIAAVDKDMLMSDYVESSTRDQIGSSISMAPVRAALSILTGTAGIIDMARAPFAGTQEQWKVVDTLEEWSAMTTAIAHDSNHKMLSEASDVASEMVRMYISAQMGTGLASAATKLSSTAKGTNYLFNFFTKNASRIPFVGGAIGNYYNEAKNNGATSAQARQYAIPAGLLEGYLESLEMGQVMKNTFGANFVGKKIAASGLSANFKQFVITKGMPFINFALDVIGEGVEESLSAIGSSILRTATWDEYHQLDMSDVWENAKGGLILGAVMGGLSMPANTQSHKYASEIYKNTGDYSKYIDSLQSAVYVENMDEAKQNTLLAKAENGEIAVDREAAIDAEADIRNAEENIAAKKAAVEAAEEDAAIKIDAAKTKVKELEKRIATLRENNGVKKAKKISELSAQLSAAKKSLAQVESESQKKVATATADYQAIAAKSKKAIAKNQQTVDEYHAAKYVADAQSENNAVSAPQTVEPNTNTTETTNAPQSLIDTVKMDADAERLQKTTEVDVESADIGYLESVDSRIVEAVEANRRGELNDMKPIKMSAVSSDMASRIAELTGIDVTGFVHGIQKDGIEHIEKRHGERGEADSSMANAEDIARMQFVLDNYDSVDLLTENGKVVTSWKYRDKNNKAAPVIQIVKQVDGHYYVSEAVPDSKSKTLWVTTAYINKKRASQVADAQEADVLAPNPTPGSDHDNALNKSISTPTASVNGELKDLGANTPTPVEMAESKVYSNTYDKWLTDAEKLADNTGNAWYARSKEVDTLATAKSVVEGSIRRNGNLDSVMAQLQDKNAWDATDVDTAMLVAETLRSEAATTGDYTKLNEWKNVIRQNMTQSGQAIQALAKWTRNSSIAAEAALDKAVDNINKKNKKKIDAGKATAVEVNPELMAELQAAETDEQREEVVNKIAADIGAKMPVGLADKINAWRYLSMLGNPRTMIRNLVGNEIMSDVLWVGKDAVGTLLESGLDQSQRTKSLMFGEEYKANRNYAVSTLKEAKNKLEGSSRYDTKRGIEKAIADNTPVFKLKNVEGARKVTNWALSKGDSVFLEKQYNRSFAQIMTARGYTPDTITETQKKECMDYAIAEAQRSTFHDASVVADAISKLENRNGITKVLVGGVLPFKKTPINVLARGVDFSPIGLIQGTTQYITKVKSGEMSAAQAVDKISSGLTGSALMALGFFLAKSGVITGGNEDEDKYYMSDLGHQEFALNLGDGKSVTIDWAAPATIPLFMGAALNSVVEGEGADGDNKLDALINTLSGITDPLVEMSMLQGLQDTLEAAAESTKNDESVIWGLTKNAAYNYASSFVPTIGGQIARTIDPVRRDTTGDPTTQMGSEFDKVTNKIQAKIPGVASNLEPYTNVWGEKEINEHSWPVRLLENSIFPGYLDETDMTPVDVEITRLYSETQNPKVIPNNYPYSDRTFKDSKTGDIHVLTNKELTEFKIDNGRAMYAAALDAINDPYYSLMDDDERARFVGNAIESARYAVIDKYKKKYLNKD